MKHLSTLKSLLLVLFAVLVGVNAWGETYQHVFTAKPSTESNVNLSGISWTIAAQNLNGYNSQNYAGVQIGSSKKTGSLTLTSSSDWNYNGNTKITEVRLWLNTGGNTVTPKVTIGGTDAISDGTTVKKNSTAGTDWTKATKVTFTPADGGNSGVVVINVESEKAGYVCAMEIDCETDAGGAETKPAAPTFSLAEGTYWSVQSLVLSTTVEGGGIYYTIDGTDPTKSETSMVYSTAISLSKTTIVNACVVDADSNFSNVVSRTYTFVESIANTQETAYTTAEAKALIDERSSEQLGAEDQKVYVKGTVSKVDSYNSTYKSITYWLDDDAFEVYSGKGLDNKEFNDASDVEVGAEVIVYGNIKKFNTTYEFEKNNYLVSYKAKVLSSVAISGSATKTSYEEGETFDFSGLTLTATYDNGSTMDITSSATWTASPSVITAETTQVEVTAKYGEKSDSKQIAVTVIKPEPVEGNSIIVASYGDNKFAAMTTELKSSYFVSTEIFKSGDMYVVTGDINNVLFRTETAEGLTTIQQPSTGKYIQCTAAKNVSLSNTRYSWSNDGAKLTAGSYGSLQYNTGSPRFTTYENKVGQYAYIVDKADIVEGGVLTLSATDGTDYYATFSSDKAVEFVDAEVYTVDVTGTKLVLNEVTSKQVPANEGVLIKTTATKALYKYIDEAAGLGANYLHASSFPMKESGYMFYKLAYGDWENKADLGFYWGAANGAAFTAKAGGAYLAVPAEAGAKAFTFGDEETAIESVEAEAANEEVFDLSGRKVSKAVKGLYIINGKKVVK